VTIFGTASPINLGLDSTTIVCGLLPDSNYYFVVTAIDLSGNESGYSNIQPFHVVPADRYMQNITFPPDNVTCADGLETISTGGAGQTFTVQPAASVTLIAGQRISLLYGTHVQSGGDFHGYISPDSLFCGNIFIDNPVFPAPGDGNGATRVFSEFHGSLFRAYPNPTTGNITLELFGDPQLQPALVTITDLLGSPVLKRGILTGRMQEFSLAGMPGGIYFIRVIQAGECGIRKIVKQ
jgi:hypothetical protein